MKYSRHELLSPVPVVASRQELQELCDAFMERELSRRSARREQTIGELWQREVGELMPPPSGRFDASRARQTKVTKRSWVCSGTNFYSVPVAWVGHEVLLKLDADRVQIVGPHGETVTHSRCHGRQQMRLELSHTLPLLRREARGLDLAIPMRDWLDRQGPCWPELLRRLRRSEGEVDGSRAFVDVRELCHEYGTEVVQGAVEAALGHPDFSRETVRYQLRARRQEASEPAEPVLFDGPCIEQGSVAAYGSLLSKDVEEVLCV